VAKRATKQVPVPGAASKLARRAYPSGQKQIIVPRHSKVLERHPKKLDLKSGRAKGIGRPREDRTNPDQLHINSSNVIGEWHVTKRIFTAEF